jgi:hypothetical protein
MYWSHHLKISTALNSLTAIDGHDRQLINALQFGNFNDFYPLLAFDS